MLKGFSSQEQQHQQQQPGLLENMSNLTSASNEASGSSGTNIRSEAGSGTIYPPEYLTSNPSVQPAKRKRNLPGNPDPEAEVIALSPKTLMATNRFMCEICNKGFQRDQNLQLHRRGHNLPWKLKQRSSKEIRKKVYVCPEATCVHHDPLRALGDLTGIKKHFCRKHGEKKWKCDKCSKRYAVQSDWKAHSKICGTREYRCDCGTLFSRRDSFITHRAFCDALAEESARAITGNPLLPPSHHQPHHQANSNISISQNINLPSAAAAHHLNFTHDQIHAFSATMKKEQQNFPPWLATSPAPVPSPFDLSSTSSPVFNSTSEFAQAHHHHHHHHQDLSSVTIQENPSPSPNPSPTSLGPNLPLYHSTLQPFISPHMSATALLQKAAQMGSTMSNPRPHPQAHVPASTTTTATANDSSSGGNNNTASAFGLNFSPREEMSSGGFVMPSGSHFGSFEDAFGGILNSRKNGPFSENNISKSVMPHHHRSGMVETNNLLMKGNGPGNNNEGLTRDFLGLRPLSQSDILNIANLGDCMNRSPDDQNHDQQKSW